jgi:hypothetical protein
MTRIIEDQTRLSAPWSPWAASSIQAIQFRDLKYTPYNARPGQHYKAWMEMEARACPGKWGEFRVTECTQRNNGGPTQFRTIMFNMTADETRAFARFLLQTVGDELVGP